MAGGTVTVDRLVQILEFRLKGAAQLKQSKNIIEDVGKQVEKVEKQTKRSFASMSGSIMSFGFAALFGGMALKRLGTTIVTSLINTYMRATDEQNVFFQKLQGVNAAFEFLKFSIFDALSQSDLVIGLIDGMIQLINWVSEFANKHPLVSKVFVAFAIGAIIVGGLLMIVGQLALGFLGLLGAIDLFGAPLKALWMFMSRSLIPTIAKMGKFIWNAMVLAFRGIMMILSNPLTWLIAGFILVISVIFRMMNAMGGWGEFFKSVIRGTLNMLNILRAHIFEAMIFPLRIALEAAADLARFLASRGVPGMKSFSSILDKAVTGLNKIRSINISASERISELIAVALPKAKTEDEVNSSLSADFDAFKNAVGLGDKPQEIAIEDNKTVEINVNTTTGDPEEIGANVKKAMEDINQDFFEEQLIRLQGTTRGA